MSEAQQPFNLRETLSTRWQVPLLCAGLLLFGSGVLHVTFARQPVSFDEEVARVRRLHDLGIRG